MLSHTEARERVARGAALLDGVKPGWYRQIDTETLRLSSCFRCVLGQLFGHYSDAIQLPAIHVVNREQHGFWIELAGQEEYQVLTLAWLDLIAARLRDEQDAPVIVWTHREPVDTSA
jgi:hypothetical protein